MRRTRHMVAYDIREPKRLRLVHRVMKGFGMPFQYSVFLCDLTSAERYELLSELERIIDRSEDCVAAVELGDPDDSGIFTFLGPRPAMPTGKPKIL